MLFRTLPCASLVTLVSLVFLLSACGSSGSSSSAMIPPPPPPPPAEENLPLMIISENAVAEFVLLPGDNQGDVGSASTVSVDHQDFDQAIQIDVQNPNGQVWNGQVQIPITEAVNGQDILFLEVYFRMLETADETGTGFVTAFVESPAPEYTKYLFHQLVSAGDWVKYQLPFKINDSFDANQIRLKFGFGAGSKPQKIQLGKIQLLNYKQSTTLDELPFTRPSYLGRDPNAQWRAEAAARIEQHRKGDFSVQVLNAAGESVSDAQITINMHKHAYHFGTVAAVRHLVGDDPDSQTYRENLLSTFNQSGIENGLKWPAWVGDWGDGFTQQRTLAAVKWLNEQGLHTRGHVMVWPSKRNMPDFVQSMMPANDPASADPAVLDAVSAHIADISNKTAGMLDDWDVLNEPFDNHYLMDAFGKQVMTDWFTQAKQLNPNARMYINDYSILSGGGLNVAHQDHYFNTIDYLLANNAPLEGIGMQGHFSATPTPINKVYQILERFHNAFAELDIRITEFDVDTDDESLQADYTRDFVTLVFSHPATVGVQVWGFWEGAHWRPRAAMYRQDWSAKANLEAWRSLTQETFWNNFELLTDAQGKVSARGFYGEYKVLVTVDGVQQSFDIEVAKGSDNQFMLTLN